MELKKELWTSRDLIDLNYYLISIKREEKIEWTRNIVNTKMDLYGIPNPELKSIANEIYKGNYISYLDQYYLDNYDLTLIYAYLLNKIKDYNLKKKYLDKYSLVVDNWSSVDSLKFNIKNNMENYLELSNLYIKDKLPFKRRIGVIILFSYKKNLDYYDKIFSILDKLIDEEDYYVSMAISWLLCELCIFNKESVIKYVKNSNFSNFIKKKFVSKCHDSFRIDTSSFDELYNML